MTWQLRRNVILRDWFSGIDKYRCMYYGQYPEYVEMNKATMMTMINYLYKTKRYELDWNTDIDYARDEYGNIIVSYRRECAFFEGIKIYFRDDLENEVMMIW